MEVTKDDARIQGYHQLQELRLHKMVEKILDQFDMKVQIKMVSEILKNFLLEILDLNLLKYSSLTPIKVMNDYDFLLFVKIFLELFQMILIAKKVTLN
jgi:hypothetical protein